MKAALLIIDTQNDFCEGGALEVPFGQTIVPLINRLAEEFRKQNFPVIFSQDMHPSDHCSFVENGGIWPTHCVAETKGSDLHPDLHLKEGDIVVHKGTDSEVEAYSAFDATTTDLEDYLKNEGVEEVFICGLAYDYCVYATYSDAVEVFDSSVILDAVKAVNNDESLMNHIENDTNIMFSWEVLDLIKGK